MASSFSRTTDCIDLQNVALPYDRYSKELDDTPRITTGSNLLGLENGNLIKRPGFPLYASLPAIAGRVDRLLIYQTEEATPKVYILASVFGGTTWKLWYIRPDAGSPAWTTVGTLRFVDASTRPHEMVSHKGKVYIKGFPSGASGEKLGSVVWDGSGTPSLKVWGVIGPTIAARLTVASASWAASAHAVTVRLGWKYAYAWTTAATGGHISNRSPQETNPDNLSSNTGAFVTKKPQINLQGNADTANFPFINVYRTLDGGGNWLFLEQVTNTGAGIIAYIDDSRVSGAGQQDPIADFMLDTANIAPSETSNDPPPPVTDPLVVGTDTPERATNIISQHGRLWFGIRGNLFYSGLEEIFNGLPEHCWPSGFGGNYFSVGETSVAVDNAPNGVIHWTNKNAYVVRGFNRESFAHTLLLSKSGMPLGHPRAHASYQDVVFWVTQDFRVVALVNEQLVVLSKDLKDDIKNQLGANREIELAVWAEQEKQYLFVLVVDKTNGSASKMWIYDLVRGKWNTPWSVRLTALASDQARETVETGELIGAMYDGTNTRLTNMSFVTKQDYDVTTAALVNYSTTLDTNLMRVPIGNHMNPLRRPVVVPDVLGFVISRTKFASDTDPTASSLEDDFGISYTALTAEANPPRRAQSTGFKELWYYLNKARQRTSLRIATASANEDFEIQTLSFLYRPEAGV